MLKIKWYLPVLAMLLILLVTAVVACAGEGNKDPALATETEVGIVVGRAVGLRGPIQDYYYEVDIEILESHDVEGSKNPTKDKVGKVLTVFSREDMTALNIGEGIVCHVTLFKAQGQQSYIGSGFFPVTLKQKQQ